MSLFQSLYRDNALVRRGGNSLLFQEPPVDRTGKLSPKPRELEVARRAVRPGPGDPERGFCNTAVRWGEEGAGRSVFLERLGR